MATEKKKSWSFACIMKACPETSSVLEYIQAKPVWQTSLALFMHQTTVQKVNSHRANLDRSCHCGRLMEKRGSGRGRGHELPLWY